MCPVYRYCLCWLHAVVQSHGQDLPWPSKPCRETVSQAYVKALMGTPLGHHLQAALRPWPGVLSACHSPPPQPYAVSSGTQRGMEDGT